MKETAKQIDVIGEESNGLAMLRRVRNQHHLPRQVNIRRLTMKNVQVLVVEDEVIVSMDLRCDDDDSSDD